MRYSLLMYVHDWHRGYTDLFLDHVGNKPFLYLMNTDVAVTD